MLVIGDETKHRGMPWMTLFLVVVNVLAFAVQVKLGMWFTYGYSLVPAEITTGVDLTEVAPTKITEQVQDARGIIRYHHRFLYVPQTPGPEPIYLTLLTSMFMHAGGLHLIGNLWFLIIFGRNVELAMGRILFLLFYLTSGLAGGLAHVLLLPDSVLPYLGASAAISGVLGAYFFLFPINNVKVWLVFCVIEIPAFIFLGLWVLLQYVNTIEAVTSTEQVVHTGIAYWAHLGGFLAGIAFLLILLLILKTSAAVARSPG